MNMRTIRAGGRGSRRAEDGVVWGSLWPGPELVLFGHHAMRGLQHHPHAIGLDTGCVYGGRLSCIRAHRRALLGAGARRVRALDDSPRLGAS